jgi:hypothetical protein
MNNDNQGELFGGTTSSLKETLNSISKIDGMEVDIIDISEFAAMDDTESYALKTPRYVVAMEPNEKGEIDVALIKFTNFDEVDKSEFIALKNEVSKKIKGEVIVFQAMKSDYSDHMTTCDKVAEKVTKEYNSCHPNSNVSGTVNLEDLLDEDLNEPLGNDNRTPKADPNKASKSKPRLSI